MSSKSGSEGHMSLYVFRGLKMLPGIYWFLLLLQVIAAVFLISPC